MVNGQKRKTLAGIGLATGVLALIAHSGCTSESVRVALRAQQRADQVQQAVFERQHEALCILLYRDLERRLAHSGAPLTIDQRSMLNEVWNERDLVEFWTVQQERARALRLVGVDARLYSDQSVLDLLYKSLSAKLDRIKLGAAAQAGQRAVEQIIDNNGSE